MTEAAWIVMGGSFELDRNKMSWVYDLVDPGRGIGEVVESNNIYFHLGLFEGEGLPAYGFVALELVAPSVTTVSPFPINPSVSGSSYFTGAPNGFMYRSADGLLGIIYSQLSDNLDGTVNFSYDVWTIGASDPLVAAATLYPSVSLTFTSGGFADWRGPFFVGNYIYAWIMDGEVDYLRLYRLALDSPASWEKVYEEALSHTLHWYVCNILELPGGRLVATPIFDTTSNVLYSDDDGATWTKVSGSPYLGGAEFGAFLMNGEIYHVIGNNDTMNVLKVAHSADGVTWDIIGVPVTGLTAALTIYNPKTATNETGNFLCTVRQNPDSSEYPLILFGTVAGVEARYDFPHMTGRNSSYSDASLRLYLGSHIEAPYYHAGLDEYILPFLSSGPTWTTPVTDWINSFFICDADARFVSEVDVPTYAPSLGQILSVEKGEII